MTVDLDPSDELVEALDILAEEANLWSADTPAEHDEFFAAVSSILLLVPELLNEYSAAWAAVAELRQLINGLQAQVAELKEQQGLWTPRVELPSAKAP